LPWQCFKVPSDPATLQSSKWSRMQGDSMVHSRNMFGLGAETFLTSPGSITHCHRLHGWKCVSHGSIEVDEDLLHLVHFHCCSTMASWSRIRFGSIRNAIPITGCYSKAINPIALFQDPWASSSFFLEGSRTVVIMRWWCLTAVSCSCLNETGFLFLCALWSCLQIIACVVTFFRVELQEETLAVLNPHIQYMKLFFQFSDQTHEVQFVRALWDFNIINKTLFHGIVPDSRSEQYEYLH
jgi:hypothetical protein